MNLHVRPDLDTQAADEITRKNGMPIVFVADARSNKLKSGVYTMTGAVVSITVPTGARGVVIYANASTVRYAVDEDPAAVGSGALTVGGIARVGLERAVGLESGAATLRLLGVNTDTVDVEFV